jgi:hypothetical protein
MRSLRRFFTRVVNSVTGRVHDERLREEIETHIALETAENVPPVCHRLRLAGRPS